MPSVVFNALFILVIIHWCGTFVSSFSTKCVFTIKIQFRGMRIIESIEGSIPPSLSSFSTFVCRLTTKLTMGYTLLGGEYTSLLSLRKGGEFFQLSRIHVHVQLHLLLSRVSVLRVP